MQVYLEMHMHTLTYIHTQNTSTPVFKNEQHRRPCRWQPSQSREKQNGWQLAWTTCYCMYVYFLLLFGNTWRMYPYIGIHTCCLCRETKWWNSTHTHTHTHLHRHTFTHAVCTQLVTYTYRDIKRHEAWHKTKMYHVYTRIYARTNGDREGQSLCVHTHAYSADILMHTV